MNRENLERHQVWLYLLSVALGLLSGLAVPMLGGVLEILVWPSLALLLYATFTQVPLNELPAAFRDRRFMLAALAGNFLIIPCVVWGLLYLVSDDPAIRLGILLVLLVPCTDWFLTFTHQGRGDLKRAIAITPVLLIVQMILLPLYLWLFVGAEFLDIVSGSHVALAFMVVIVLPFALAWFTEHWAGEDTARAARISQLGWLPVPCLAIVLYMIAGSQVEAVSRSLPVIGDILLACLTFLVAMVILAILVGRLARLPVDQTRTLVFSFGTRNSFVVLPFALALPDGWELVAIVIALQSLIELLGMLVLLWLIPRRILR